MFEEFSFDDPAQEQGEDPFGLARSARDTQWWTGWGTPKKRRTTTSGLPFPGVPKWEPDLAGPAPTPNPSTTQRLILESKDSDENLARALNGTPRQDTGADDPFASDNRTWLANRYSAPSPADPGAGKAAAAITDEYQRLDTLGKQQMDQALALPARTGIEWFGAGSGSIDQKRQRLIANWQLIQQQKAQLRAENPSQFGGPPESWHPVGGNSDAIYEQNRGTIKVAGDPMAIAALKARTGNTAGRATAAPKPFAQNGKMWIQDPNDPQGRLPYGDRRVLQGPVPEGSGPLGSVLEQASAEESDTVKAARIRAGAKGGKGSGGRKVATPADRLRAAEDHRKVDDAMDKRKAAVMDPTNYQWASAPQKARDAELANIETERKRRHADVSSAIEPGKKKGGAVDKIYDPKTRKFVDAPAPSGGGGGYDGDGEDDEEE